MKPRASGMRASSPRLKLPGTLPGDGILVGWSLEWVRHRFPIGFGSGDPLRIPPTGFIDPILLEQDGHLITIAPTGAGKGTGCIVPTLLRYPGPVIVIDPKGENVAMTARRRREMGHRVVVIDPMGITDQPCDTLNPLDGINIALSDAVDEVASLVRVLDASDHSGNHAWWSSRGSHLTIGVILQTMLDAAPGTANLIDVRKTLAEAAKDPKALAGRLSDSPHPEVARIAGTLGIQASETLGGILSFSQELVDFLRGDPIVASVEKTSFDLDDVTRGAPLSIFLVLPPHMLESHGRLLRMWIGTLLRAIVRRRSRPAQSTLFILDEAAQLGELPHLRQAITLLRGYGLRTWSFWQDVSQLQRLYPRDWATMVNNCQVLQCFGALNRTAGQAMADLTGFDDGDAVLDLKRSEMVLQLAGDEAVIAQLPNYLKDPVFAGMFDPNPYHDPKREVMPPEASAQRMYTRPRDIGPEPPAQAFRPEPPDDLLDKLLEKWQKE